MRPALVIRHRFPCLALLVVVLLATRRPSAAVTVTAVHAFGGTDGSHPMAGLFLGADDNFYGTTSEGGTGVTDPAGTVFRVAPDGDFTSLYTFDFQVTGDEPFGGVVADGDGNLYGTTRGTGAYLGNVFKLGASFTDLHGFAGYFFGPDGSHPESAPVLASDGNLYGVTSDGGNNNIGSVYRITTSNNAYLMIHSFNGAGIPADGFTPRGGLVNGSDGDLYGTTAGGGPSGAHGTVFKMTTAGVVTTLHTFVGTDGDGPLGTLVQANDGNFYGTTGAGGAHSSGTVFRVSPSGDFAILYSFDSATGGYSPAAGLVQASDGDLYGTTQFGGDNSLGTIFRMSLDGTPDTIHSFAFQGAEGFVPRGALVEGPDGKLYGTTHDGGNACSCGAVFKLTPEGPSTTTSTIDASTTSTTDTSTTTSSSTSTTDTSTATSSSTSTTVLASTSSTTLTTTTTSTTLPAGGCADAPSGPTFTSVRCRLVALRDQASGEPRLGSYAAKLEKTLDKAIARLDDAKSHCMSAAGTKKAKSRLGQVKKALTQYVHRLSGLPARKKLDPTLRQTFVAGGTAITPDVTTLRAQLVCPVPDAG